MTGPHWPSLALACAVSASSQTQLRSAARERASECPLYCVLYCTALPVAFQAEIDFTSTVLLGINLPRTWVKPGVDYLPPTSVAVAHCTTVHTSAVNRCLFLYEPCCQHHEHLSRLPRLPLPTFHLSPALYCTVLHCAAPANGCTRLSAFTTSVLPPTSRNGTRDPTLREASPWHLLKDSPDCIFDTLVATKASIVHLLTEGTISTISTFSGSLAASARHPPAHEV